LIGKVTVKYDPRPATEAQERNGVGNQIAEDHVEPASAQGHRADQVRHARDHAWRAQTLSDVAWQKVAIHPHRQGTVTGFREAAGTVVMSSKKSNPVADCLQMRSSIYDQPFGAAHAEVRVKKGNV